MRSVWQTEFQVRSYESDRSGELKPQALLNYFEEAAQQHARELGFGYEQLKLDNRFWVLARIEVAINRLPAWGEAVRVETWPKSVSRLFAIRDFLLHDGEETPLVRATSAWLLMDGSAARPLRPEKHLPQGPLRDNAEKSAMDAVPEKLSFPSEDGELLESLNVQFSDIDVNNHVNNSVYLKWLDDAVRTGEPDVRPAAFNINFLREAAIGTRVNLLRSTEKRSLLEVRSQQDEALTRARIDYRPR